VRSDGSGSASAGEGSGRVLFLFGAWRIPGDAFSLEATIAVGADGAASGPIWWRAERTPGLSGIEEVRGRVSVGSVHLDGVKTARGLACDRYRITLMGDDRSGAFDGISWTFGSWQGRMEGKYEFWRRSDG
jgi:hypothetical protein